MGVKMFACIVMLIQTVGIAVIEKGLIHLDQYTQESLNQAMSQDSRLMTLAGIGSIMQLIGGMAIPVFAFLLVEGFRNTSDYKKYLITMVITALVSEIPYDLAIRGKIWDFSSQNAMITMCICLVMLKCLDLFKETSGFTGGMLKVLILIAAIVWVSIFRAEYGLCMVLLVFVFYVFETRNVLKNSAGMYYQSDVCDRTVLRSMESGAALERERITSINMSIMLFILCICWCLE